MRMGKADDNGALYYSGNQCRSCSSGNAKPWSSEFAEYQQIVEDEIDKHSSNPCSHRQLCLSGFTQCTGIDVQQGKQRHLKEHDAQILLSVMERGCKVQGILPFVDEQGDQLVSAGQ